MSNLYLDQAATSFPKAPGLGDAMKTYFDTASVNINRSTYSACTAMSNIVLSTRELLCELFHFDDPSHVIFTPGITHSLNYIIKGYLKPGDHCIISAFEHNATVRPLCQLENEGVTYAILPFDTVGNFSLETLEGLVKPETKLAVFTHASNVFGNVLPIERLAAFFFEKGIPFVIDTAQTAGHLPIDFEALHLSALCFTAHKGLLGPNGLGGMLLAPAFAKQLTPLIAGGTGSASHLLTLPRYMPDRFESGTLNIAGIYGLYHSLCYLKTTSLAAIHTHEMALTHAFIEGIRALEGVEVIGHFPLTERVSTVSIAFTHLDQAEASYALETQHGILTRCGLHCSPLGHRTMGTYPEGTIRFSFGYANTLDDVTTALAAIASLLAP